MSEFTTHNGVTIKINEDGSVSRTGSWDFQTRRNEYYQNKPQIAKMYLSSDNLICGDYVKFIWDIIDGEENILTIEQSGYEKSCNIPSSGELNISSDIHSGDMFLTIDSKNSLGRTILRKTIFVKKRKNDVKFSKWSDVVSWLSIVIVIIYLIKIIINIILDLLF